MSTVRDMLPKRMDEKVRWENLDGLLAQWCTCAITPVNIRGHQPFCEANETNIGKQLLLGLNSVEIGLLPLVANRSLAIKDDGKL